MNDLLRLALQAHGGLQQWRQLKVVRASASLTGALWRLKGHADVFNNIQVEAQFNRQHLITHLIGENRRTTFTPGRVSSESESGELQALRDNPRSAYQGLESPWDDLHVAYFASCALWSYLTIPFLYTYPGFVSEELKNSRLGTKMENPGDRLRLRLLNRSPRTRADQFPYFGPDGLLRRHEYTIDVLGGARGPNYASDYRSSNGIIVPHKRRVFAYDGEKRKVAEPLLVAIDIHDIEFS
jgi:hypothetical protein